MGDEVDDENVPPRQQQHLHDSEDCAPPTPRVKKSKEEVEKRRAFNALINEAKTIETQSTSLSIGQLEKTLEFYKQALEIYPDMEKMAKKVAKVEGAIRALAADLAEKVCRTPLHAGFELDGTTQKVHLVGGYTLPHTTYTKLYPYQQEGLAWMWGLHRRDIGGILGDDMGLGKTVQVSAFLQGLFVSKLVKKVLIVAPLSVLSHWEAEVRKWCPGVPTHVFHEVAVRARAKFMAKVSEKGGVCFTTYGMVSAGVEHVASLTWSYVILDEGHKIKGATCKVTQAIHEVPTKHRLLLTGTPLMNNMGELYSLVDYCTAGRVLGSEAEFRTNFEGPIVRGSAKDALPYEKANGAAASARLREVTAPYLLRREKALVFDTIPVAPSSHSLQTHATTPPQRAEGGDDLEEASSNGGGGEKGQGYPVTGDGERRKSEEGSQSKATKRKVRSRPLKSVVDECGGGSGSNGESSAAGETSKGKEEGDEEGRPGEDGEEGGVKGDQTKDKEEEEEEEEEEDNDDGEEGQQENEVDGACQQREEEGKESVEGGRGEKEGCDGGKPPATTFTSPRSTLLSHPLSSSAVPSSAPAGTSRNNKASLPRKNDIILWLSLVPEQRRLYRAFLETDSVKDVLNQSSSPLAALTVMKKICDSTELLGENWVHCRDLALSAHPAHSRASSYGGKGASGRDGEGGGGGGGVGSLHYTSCKVELLAELLPQLATLGHRTLVFSQSTKMLDIIENSVLRPLELGWVRIDGQVSERAERARRVALFNSDGASASGSLAGSLSSVSAGEDEQQVASFSCTTFKSASAFGYGSRLPVCLLSTQVGGIGLTLTGADRVVIVDPTWNPALDAQAVDRAYRIGQTRNVVAYRLITASTVEEAIYRKQVYKDALARAATSSRSTSAKDAQLYRYFTRQELRDIFSLKDTTRSETQQQLHALHSAGRKTDEILNAELEAVTAMHGVVGISDHDLLFSIEDSTPLPPPAPKTPATERKRARRLAREDDHEDGRHGGKKGREVVGLEADENEGECAEEKENEEEEEGGQSESDSGEGGFRKRGKKARKTADKKDRERRGSSNKAGGGMRKVAKGQRARRSSAFERGSPPFLPAMEHSSGGRGAKSEGQTGDHDEGSQSDKRRRSKNTLASWRNVPASRDDEVDDLVESPPVSPPKDAEVPNDDDWRSSNPGQGEPLSEEGSGGGDAFHRHRRLLLVGDDSEEEETEPKPKEEEKRSGAGGEGEGGGGGREGRASHHEEERPPAHLDDSASEKGETHDREESQAVAPFVAVAHEDSGDSYSESRVEEVGTAKTEGERENELVAGMMRLSLSEGGNQSSHDDDEAVPISTENVVRSFFSPAQALPLCCPAHQLEGLSVMRCRCHVSDELRLEYNQFILHSQLYEEHGVWDSALDYALRALEVCSDDVRLHARALALAGTLGWMQ